MLVLSRRLGEEIVIDGRIRLVALSVRKGRVRLGISAPPSVSVDRKEVHDQRPGAESAKGGEIAAGAEGATSVSPTLVSPARRNHGRA